MNLRRFMVEHHIVKSSLPSAAYALVNWVTIGSDNGLSPIRRQAIIYTNAGFVFRTNFIKIKIKKLFIHENVSENIVCELAALLPGDGVVVGWGVG